MTTTTLTDDASAFHAKSLCEVLDASRMWVVQLEGNYLFRHHKGGNCHIEQAEAFKNLMIAAADHVELHNTPQNLPDIIKLCTCVRFVAEMFCEGARGVTLSRALNKQEFRAALIELIGSYLLPAELLLLELRDLERREGLARKSEAAAVRRRKAHSATILPFQPRTV
jgi:hypothetical protein